MHPVGTIHYNLKLLQENYIEIVWVWRFQGKDTVYKVQRAICLCHCIGTQGHTAKLGDIL